MAKNRKRRGRTGFQADSRPQENNNLNGIGNSQDLNVINQRILGIDKDSLDLESKDRGFSLDNGNSTSVPEQEAAGLEAAPPADLPKTPSGEQLLQLTPAELETVVETRINQATAQVLSEHSTQIERVEAEGNEQRRQLEAQLASATENLERTTQELARQRAVYTQLGLSTPQGVNPVQPVAQPSPSAASSNYQLNYHQFYLPASREPRGKALEFSNLVNDRNICPEQTAQDGNELYLAKDTSAISRWFIENQQELHADMERLLKGNGFLKGGNAQDLAVAGRTSSLELPGEFLDYLDTYMRITHSDQFIYWQFPFEGIDLGQNVGNRVLVPRYENIDAIESIEDYLIDTPQATNSISSEVQGLQQTVSPIDLFGYALGRGTKVRNRPVSVTEFITKYSLTDLMNVLRRKLMHNYNAFEDKFIREQFQTTGRTYYNNNGEITDNPANVTLDGTATEDFLDSVYSQAVTENIPFWGNAKYVWIAPPQVIKQFKRSLDTKIDAPNEANLRELTEILSVETINDGVERTSGYVGTFDNILIFQSTTSGVGVPVGAGSANNPEGVDLVDYNGGATTNVVTYDSYFFGMGPVGRGVGMPPQIRSSDRGNFGLSLDFIWRSIEGAGPMDVFQVGNPGDANYNGQQTRVYRLRTTATPIV